MEQNSHTSRTQEVTYTDTGLSEGVKVGLDTGTADGAVEGKGVGAALGNADGVNEGTAVGAVVGRLDGPTVGTAVGRMGFLEGRLVGLAEKVIEDNTDDNHAQT